MILHNAEYLKLCAFDELGSQGPKNDFDELFVVIEIRGE